MLVSQQSIGLRCPRKPPNSRSEQAVWSSIENSSVTSTSASKRNSVTCGGVHDRVLEASYRLRTSVDFTETSWNRTQIAEVDATSARIVPEDLDLSAMVGTRLDSVTFAEYMLVLSFDSGHAFSIHGRVELRDQGGHRD